MKKLTFRNLTTEDVECRVCNATDKNINLLIYKNARVDMAILNETVGMGWKREHNFKDGKNYCTVSIWDDENRIWVSREDCGVESNTEAEKGESSDAFKRACFNWGIGTELYTGPRISVTKEDKDIWNNKVTMTFSVKEMTVNDNKKITHLVIVDKWGKTRFCWDEGDKPQSQNKPVEKPSKLSVEECTIIVNNIAQKASNCPEYDTREVERWRWSKAKWLGEQNGFTGDLENWLRADFRKRFQKTDAA